MFKKCSLNSGQTIQLNKVVEFQKELKLKDKDCVVKQYAYAVFKERSKKGKFNILFLTGDYAGRGYLSVSVPLHENESGKRKYYYEKIKLGKYKFFEQHSDSLQLPFYSGRSFRIYAELGLDFKHKTITLEELQKIAEQKNLLQIEHKKKLQMLPSEKEI